MIREDQWEWGYAYSSSVQKEVGPSNSTLPDQHSSDTPVDRFSGIGINSDKMDICWLRSALLRATISLEIVLPSLMKVHFPNRRKSFRRQGISVFCLLLSISVHHNVAAQDVAEAARQQRANKSQYSDSPHHIYTEEDLKRPRILIPEDQNRVEARRECSSAPASLNLSALDVEADAQPTSLGDIARRYRKEKAAREALAMLNKKPSPFPSEASTTPFAEAKSSVPLLRSTRTVVSSAVVATGPAPFERSAGHARVSPFQPRPLIASTLTRANLPMRTATVNFMQIRVRSGESWWSLARRYLGSGSRWKELASLNSGLPGRAEFLRSGSTILVPSKGNSHAFPEPMPETLMVHRGDTLRSLSRAHFGRGSD